MTSPRWRIEIQKIFLDIRNLKKKLEILVIFFEKFCRYSKSCGIFGLFWLLFAIRRHLSPKYPYLGWYLQIYSNITFFARKRCAGGCFYPYGLKSAWIFALALTVFQIFKKIVFTKNQLFHNFFKFFQDFSILFQNVFKIFPISKSRGIFGLFWLFFIKIPIPWLIFTDLL